VFISYSYQVDGVKYGSEHYDFTSGESGSLDWVTATVAQYHPTQQTFCYIEPADSTHAVLSPTAEYSTVFVDLGLVVVLAFLGAMFIALCFVRLRDS
jgi:hypothetical protein